MADRPAGTALPAGGAMLEMAPVSDGLYRRNVAGGWIGTRFAAGVGRDPFSDLLVAEMAADMLDASGVQRDAARRMELPRRRSRIRAETAGD